MERQDYHIPVMLSECIDALAIKPDGVYVDVTFGGGGHSKKILESLGANGVLIAFDQDPDALMNAIDDDRFTLVHQNFRFARNHLRLLGHLKVDGILADLGISSHQIDDPQRGFATRFDAELDMRMDQVSDLSAKKIVNTYMEEDLHRLLGLYGEVKNARTLARAIVSRRAQSDILTVDDFKEAIQGLAPRGRENRYFAQVFQALRIEVNQELEALQEFLLQTPDVLREGGRLVVMSYHSLEDRLVKSFLAKGKFKGEVEKDFYGNEIKPFELVTRKPLMAKEEEVGRNNRARSAKLRVAEKI